jgi:hypothetical protein
MKAAPVGPKGTFGAADWQEIKQSLAVIGVDLNTARISAHFEARRAGIYRYATDTHPWLSAGPEWRLRDVLQRLGHFYTLPEPRTAKQWAKELQKALAATEKARTALRLVRLAPANYPDNAMRSDAAKDRALYDLMTWKITELQKCIAKLRAIDSRSQSALTVQAKYWRELTDLWWACGGKLHENALRRFLLACSRAPFAEIRAEQLEDKIESFISHQPHTRQRKAQTTL